MGDFVKWFNRAMYVFVLLLLVAIVISNNSESGDNAMIITNIFKWILLFGTVAVAGLKEYVKCKNNPENAYSELRVMAMIICGVVGAVMCILLSFDPDSSINVWQEWIFWTCVVVAIVGVGLWVVIRKRKNG